MSGTEASCSPLELPRSRRRFLACLTALSLAPLLACQSRHPLRIAAHVWPGYELMYLARSQGLLPPQIELVDTASASESLTALFNRRVNAAALTLDEVLRARDQGLDLTITLVFDISAGADVVMAQPYITTLSDLAGKRIGVETTALGAFIFQQLLAAANLKPRDVILVPVEHHGHQDAWQDARLDAQITYEPTVSRLEELGAHRLFDSRQLPDSIFDVLAVLTDQLQEQSRNLSTLAAGHFRALEHLRRSPQDAGYRMAIRMQLSGAEALKTFRGLDLPNLVICRHLLGDPRSRLIKAATQLSAVMLEAGILRRPAVLDQLLSAEHLPREA